MTINKRLIGILVAAGLILLAPLVAMQFTDQVNWGPFDFAVAGVLLFGTGFLVELTLQVMKKKKLRLAIVIFLLVLLVLVWVELAVGIFD